MLRIMQFMKQRSISWTELRRAANAAEQKQALGLGVFNFLGSVPI